MSENQHSVLQGEKNVVKNIFLRLHIYLNALWLFFPGILLIVVGLFALTGLEQGRDLVITSVESVWSPGFSLAAVSFWAFISWYSARLVSHEKIRKIGKELSGPFRYIPRANGLGCYLVFEIAILNLRFFHLSFWLILFIITALYIILILAGKRLIDKGIPVFEKWPFRTYIIILMGFIILLDSISFALDSYFWKLSTLFIAHFVTGLLFINFTYFRRIYLDRKFKAVSTVLPVKNKEEDFLAAFAAISILGLIIYCLPVISPALAAWVGSLNFVLTGLGIMLFIGNFLTFYSVRTGINLHLFIFLGLLLAGFFMDPYQIKSIHSGQQQFNKRMTLNEYFESWYTDNKNLLDDSSNNKSLPVYISLADGGASRSGYWVAQVLGTLEDSIGISKHLLCISGASGGSVGNLAYYDLLVQHYEDSFRIRSAEFLKHDFLTFTLSRMISPAYFLNDRGNALEKALVYGNHDMNNPFSEYIIKDHNTLPVIYVNTTRMQDSHPAVVSNIRYDPEQLNDRLDVLHILDSLNQDIRVSSVAILSSRFPYVSPAGGIGNDYFVDGGYFDNSGAGAAHETILSLMKYLKENHPQAISKIHFKVIHISNSVDSATAMNRVNPIVNDLAAPLKVLMASYGQQTEINTLRLHRYLEGLEKFSDSTDWYDINLYAPGDCVEYSMSWYMSDDCRRRIDKRLDFVTKGRIHDMITDFGNY